MRVMVLALGPFGLGYFLSYLFRAVNAIIEKDLVAEIGLGPADLGLVTSAYLGAFALAQLPLGVLLDRFGPRRVQTVLVAVGGAGALVFAFAEDVTALVAGRAMIGLGFAGGLMAGFKAVVIWVSEPRRALANALVMSAGGLGLLVATAPMEWATQAFGWRQVFMALATLSFLFAMTIFLLVPEKNNGAGPDGLWRQIRGFGEIFADRAFLAIVPLAMMTSGCHIAIQTLWAGPWLRDVAGLDADGVAATLGVMAVAFLFGILATGSIADWLVRRGVSLLNVMLGFVLLFMASQVGIVIGLTNALLMPQWFVFGMLGQVSVLAFPWLASYFGVARSGRAQTAANLLIFGMAFVMQYAMGAIIELFPERADGGYSLVAYQYAFGAALALQVLALLWYLANGSALRRGPRGEGQ